jgi:tetratricopeptide (TPR) repeat protein
VKYQTTKWPIFLEIRNLLVWLTLFGFNYSSLAQGTAEHGFNYLSEQQYKSARNCFQQHLKSQPGDVYAQLGLGNSLLALNAVDSAKWVFQKILAVNALNPFALSGMGIVSLLNKDRENEAAFFERARRADKSNPDIYSSIAEGCIRFSRQDTASALIYLRQGLDLFPKSANLHLAMGRLEALKRSYGAAINAFNRANFFDPLSAIAYRETGIIQLRSHAFQDALHSLNKSIALQPDQILGYKYLGDLYYSTGKYAEAENAYQTYMERADVTMDDEERLAITLFFNKKYMEAETLLERVMTESGKESVLLRIRGYIACETDDVQNGLSLMNRFFQLHDPKKIIASDYGYYAKLLQKAGEESKAMVNFRKAISLDRTIPEYLEVLAKLASKNRLHPEAAACYTKLIELGADRSIYNFLLGKEFYFEGELWREKYDSLRRLNLTSKIAFADSNAVKNEMQVNYLKADSAFTVVSRLNAAYAGGYIWKGRIQSILDPEAATFAAKENYQKALEILEKGDLSRNQKSIIECYKYLGSYYYLGYERFYLSDKVQSAGMRSKCIECFTKILSLDPADPQAKDVLSKMKASK